MASAHPARIGFRSPVAFRAATVFESSQARSAAPGLLLTGTGGADLLRGGSGADRIEGLAGNDTLLGQADDDWLLGGADHDRLLGNAGNDTLDGGSGNDTMFGGGGDDTYVVDNVGDRVFEMAGQGFDTIETTLTYLNLWTYGGTVEAAKYVGTGRARLEGTIADNLLVGANNQDTLSGYGGNDTLLGGDGNDILSGMIGDDWIDGQAGDDYVAGQDGNDTVIGGPGRDTMYGGPGDDTFAFADGDFAGTGATTADRIETFGNGNDIIDLSAVDAVVGGGDNAFVFIGTSAFSNTAGELRYTHSNGTTMIYGDTNGDGTADLAIALTGTISLGAADFIL